jgi:hypothetical protein
LPDASSAVPIEDIDTLGALDQREAALDRRRDALNRDLAGATSLAVVADVKRQLEELDDEERVLHNRRPLVARAEQARAEEREARRRAALERHAAEFYLAADPVLDRLVELHRELAPLRERAEAAGVESAEPWSPGINGRGRFEGVWQLLDRIALYVEGEWATTIVPWAEQTVGATTTAGGTAAARAR